ncbi:N-6 DNA methylase [Lipingzhangella sp. LS1_29]|uniref:N-6 DNA methylase n=1 Tax=Lipingzhangella rawalii TaxID=2055835 RepID=A0ABU2H8F5_9ACTN|nr:N-6 DNA methylase [Lipingzhangella rawalii]MDS1271588.1 N-6 DNA methylase [Lipingzhangella rawalii]
MTAEPDSDLLLSAGDIARITGVRRPAVSNWRRRYPDFPGPVGGTATHPLFAWDQVEAWCGRHRKPFRPDAADRLWRRAEAVVGGSAIALFLAHVGLHLTGDDPPAQLELPAPEWEPLLAEAAQHPDPVALYTGLVERYTETWARPDHEPSPELAELMVQLAEVTPADTVLDPTCGTGALAAAAATAGAARVLLQDRDPVRGIIARTRIQLTGTDTRLVLGDALTEDGHTDTPADLVLCTPQERDREWNRDELEIDPRWRYGLPPSNESELAWIQHCLARVRPEGQVIVRVPAATATRRSGRRIRANLLRAGVLRAVLEVPHHLDSDAHLWLLCPPESPTERPTHLLSVTGAEDPTELRTAWARFRVATETDRVDLGEHATAIARSELLDQDVSLTRPQTVAPTVETPQRLVELHTELERLLAELPHPPRLATPAQPIPPPTTSVAALVASGQLTLLRAPQEQTTDGGDIPVLTPTDLRRGHPPSGHGTAGPDSVRLCRGDVIVPPRGEGCPRVAGPAEDAALLSPPLAVLRATSPELDPQFLAGFLNEQPAGRRGSTGQSRARGAELPALSSAQQRVYGEALQEITDLEEQLQYLSRLAGRWAEEARRALRTGTATPQEAPDAR